MSKKSKRPSRANRERRNSPLESHIQDGRVFKAPFMAVGNFETVDWARDYWPDMIWICTVVHYSGQHDGLRLCARVLDVVDEVAASYVSSLEEREKPVFDGRLTGFEQVPEDLREAVIGELERTGIYKRAFPKEFARVLALYPSAPGRWLAEPWFRRDESVSLDREVALGYLSPVRVESAFHQSQLATDAKFIVLRQFVKAGKLRLPDPLPAGFALLSRYPENLTDEEMRRARPTIRATWHMLAKSGDESRATSGPMWAREFWRANWYLFPCAEDSSESGEKADEAPELRAMLSESLARVENAGRSFLDIAKATDPDLYAPDRYEVLTGIAMRAVRLVRATLATPVLWSEEFVLQMTRIVVEALIVMKWLIHENNQELYVKYKDYGRGRLKLLKLHSEEYLESLEDRAPDGLKTYIDFLDAEVNSEINEEFQNIDTRSTFSGKTMRDMAFRIGMEREYRLYFAPGSAATHGEWPILDRYSLSRCPNPLHGGHRRPHDSEWIAVNPESVSSMMEILDRILETYRSAMMRASNSE